MIDLLYKEEILEHYREPLHFGNLKNPTHSAHQRNPLCGDDIQIELQLSNKIENIAFVGSGCAISIAASSMLTEYALGKTKAQLQKFTDEDMISLLGIVVSETRKKCALLAIATLKEALAK